MSKQPHIPALDGLRGVAVLLVFVYHYGGGTHSSVRAMQVFGYLNKGGWAGVTLFFILSGYLITGILWESYNSPHWWRNFYMRRSLRIFPLYFGTIGLVLVASAFVGTFGQTAGMIWVPLLFLQNIPPLIGHINQLPSPLPLFHFWSLAVEEQFYLIWPFLLALQKSRRRAMTLCMITFLLACVFRVVVWQTMAHPQDYVEFLLTRAGELAAGGWLALASREQEWTTITRFAPVAGLLGLLGFLYAGVHGGGFEPPGRWMMELGLPCLTFFFASLLVMAIRPGVIQQLLSAGWLRWIGNISYGIYVFHILLIQPFHALTHQIVGNRGPMAQNAVSFAVAAAGSVLAAWLSFHFFEKRFLRLKRYFPA